MNRKITSMNLDGTDRTDVLAVGRVLGLAVDWISELIYWTDFLFSTIEVARVDGTGRKTLYWYSTLNGTHLQGMVVHPKRGLMFWILSGYRPAIVRARMDGSLLNPIIDRNLGSPNAVAIDYGTDILYWVDSANHRIESSDMSGGNRRVILEDQWFAFNGFHILVKDRFVYWSEWADCRLNKAPLPGPSSRINKQSITIIHQFNREYYNRPLGFTLVDLKSPRDRELTSKLFTCGYSNGGCLPIHICLPVTANVRRCACPNDALDCTEYVGRIGQSIAALLPPPINSERPTTTSMLESPDLPPESTPARTRQNAATGLDATTSTEPVTPTAADNTFNAVVGERSTTDAVHKKSQSFTSENLIVVLSLSITVFVGFAVAILIGITYIIGKRFITVAGDKDELAYIPVRRSSSLASSIQSTPSRTGDNFILQQSSRTRSEGPLHLQRSTYSTTLLQPVFQAEVDDSCAKTQWLSTSVKSNDSSLTPNTSTMDTDNIHEPIYLLMPRKKNKKRSTETGLSVSIGEPIINSSDDSMVDSSIPPPIPPRTYMS